MRAKTMENTTLNPRSRTLFGILVLLVVFAAQPALANVVGMRISLTQVDAGTGDVDFDATAFMPSSPPELQLGLAIDRTLAFTYSTVLADYYGLGSVSYRVQVGSRSDFNTAPHPAVAFGDGNTVPTATLAWVGGIDVGGTTYQGFRGSFSHTYPPNGNYDLRIFAGPDGETDDPGNGPDAGTGPVAGNAIVGNLVNEFSTFRIVAPLSNTGSPVLDTANGVTLSYPNTRRYITARTAIDLGPTTGTTTGGPGGGGTVIEIPTLSTYWTLGLAALLALSGALLLRRR